jgi:hypothetical protein
MANLEIKDGAGSTRYLKTTLSGSDHIPHHVVEAISATVAVTASQASPLYVTGTVNTVVDADKYAYPGGILGALITKITASENDPVHITSSFINPIYVTSSIGRELYITNTISTPVYVSSSNSYPVITRNSVASSIARTGFSSFGGTIDWAGTGSSNISGTFILANSSSTRKGLMFANNTDRNLYVALGDTDLAATNGFLLSTTASAPSSYSFILYPSGTYFAEQEFVNIKHSGFFVSSSVGVSITVVSTE